MQSFLNVAVYLLDFDFFLKTPALFSFLAATFSLLFFIEFIGPGPDRLERPVLLTAEVDLLDFFALLLRSATADLGDFPDELALPEWLVLLLSERGAP
jgi:hypothetical protein